MRSLAVEFLQRFEEAGGEAATAAVRRYAPDHDPGVTDAALVSWLIGWLFTWLVGCWLLVV